MWSGITPTTLRSVTLGKPPEKTLPDVFYEIRDMSAFLSRHAFHSEAEE